MRPSRPLLLAGTLALVAGVAVAAAPAAPVSPIHVMNVALPDGSVQEVRYAGDTPPRMMLIADPLAEMDRVAAAMDAQMAAMMRNSQVQMQALQRAAMATAAQGGQGMRMTGAWAAPAGTQFSYVSTTTVNGKTCTTSLRQIAGEAGEPPRMLRQVSGDGCASAVARPQGLIPTATPTTPKAPTVPRDTI